MKRFSAYHGRRPRHSAFQGASARGGARRVRADLRHRRLACEALEPRYLLELPPFWQALHEPGSLESHANDHFGEAVAADGNWAVVGAPGYNGNVGRAYVFDITTGGEPVATLEDVSPQGADQFGFSVAISGDTIVVGAPYRDDTATDTGIAYVYKRTYHSDPPGWTWDQIGTVHNPELATHPAWAAGDNFGYSVAISGTTAVLGVPNDTPGNDLELAGAGSAYVFDLPGGSNWSVTTDAPYGRLNHQPDMQAGESFGSSVGISRTDTSGPFVAIGAPNWGSLYHDVTGRASLFALEAGAYTHEYTLTDPDSVGEHSGNHNDDYFGFSVAVCGTTVVVGRDADEGEDTGLAFVFDAEDGNLLWRLHGPYYDLNNHYGAGYQGYDDFGHSVAISGTNVVVGAGNKVWDSDQGHEIDNDGSASVFDLADGQPGGPTGGEEPDPEIGRLPVNTLADPNTSGLNTFGWSVAVSGGIVVTGAPYADDGSTDSGIVYLAARSPDLIVTTDTGISDCDNITKLDNSDGSKTLQFAVFGTTPGATIKLYADHTTMIGSIVATDTTTTVTTDGTHDLADGVRDITATQTIGGTESGHSLALKIQVDTVAPPVPDAPVLQAASDLGPDNWDNITCDNTPRFNLSGLTIPPDYLRFYRDDGQISARISGYWETGDDEPEGHQPGTPYPYTTGEQPDGTYEYAVASVDLAGNESAQSSAVTVTIHTGPPLPVFGTIDPNPRSDPVDSITIHFVDEWNVYGNIAIQSLSLTRDGGGNMLDPDQPPYPHLNYNGTTGEWTLEPLTDLTEAVGHYVLAFTGAGSGIQDKAGNEPSDGTVDWDVVPPVSDPPAAPDLTAASDTGISSTDNITKLNNTTGKTLDFAVSDTISGATVTIYANGTAIGSATATGTTTTVTTDGTHDLTDGAHSITARQTVPGYAESPDSPILSISIDTAMPAAPGLSLTNDTGISSSDKITMDSSLTLTGVETGASVEYSTDGAATWASSFTAAEGANSVQVRQADVAGNVGAVSTALGFTLDTTAPTASITAVSPDPRTTSVSTIDTVFTENVYDAALSAWSLARDGGANLLAPPDQYLTNPGGDLTILRLNGLGNITATPGHYVLTLTGAGSGIRDAAGNLYAGTPVEQWTTNPTTFNGTAGHDIFTFTVGASSHSVSVTLDGQQTQNYTYLASQPLSLTFNADGGIDTMTITGGTAQETLLVHPGQLTFDGATGTYHLTANSIEELSATSGGGQDTARFYDTTGSDTFWARGAYAEMTNGTLDPETGVVATGTYTYLWTASGFTYTYGQHNAGGTGVDRAYFRHESGNDPVSFSARSYQGYVSDAGQSGINYRNLASDFNEYYGYGMESTNDAAYFRTTGGGDTFTANPDPEHPTHIIAELNGITPGGKTVKLYAYGFKTHLIMREDGDSAFNTAILMGSTGNDTFVGTPNDSTFTYSTTQALGQTVRLTYWATETTHRGFDKITVDGNGGNDTATLTGSSTGTNTFWGKLADAVLSDGALDLGTGDLTTPRSPFGYYFKLRGFDAAADSITVVAAGTTNQKHVIDPIDYTLAFTGTWTDI